MFKVQIIRINHGKNMYHGHIVLTLAVFSVETFFAIAEKASCFKTCASPFIFARVVIAIITSCNSEIATCLFAFSLKGESSAPCICDRIDDVTSFCFSGNQ